MGDITAHYLAQYCPILRMVETEGTHLALEQKSCYKQGKSHKPAYEFRACATVGFIPNLTLWCHQYIKPPQHMG
eukprot:2332707-Ditylum_brightwellii.AAC.2